MDARSAQLARVKASVEAEKSPEALNLERAAALERMREYRRGVAQKAQIEANFFAKQDAASVKATAGRMDRMEQGSNIMERRG